MGETKIEWVSTKNADGTVTPGYTFNPWIGCTKVSPGCQHCYAEAYARRYGKAEWGPHAQRVRTSDAYWRKPLTWNRKAEQEGRRAKVFCASLADVFEDKAVLDAWRYDLFLLIEQTPNLDWLLLTKRPENVATIIERHYRQGVGSFFERNPHVWVGTSVENQEQADKRIPELLEVPAKVRFLSMEPLLGPVDLSWGLMPQFAADDFRHEPWRNGVEWVIVGGESGPHARPMRESWVLSIAGQCKAAEVPFFFKQWGEWEPRKGYLVTDVMNRVGKAAAGRLLDGRTWDETP